MTPSDYRIAALYQFGHIEDAVQYQRPLKDLCLANEVCGTLIVAEEGINGTIAGPHQGIENVLNSIREIPGFESLEIKESWSDSQPFFRIKVHHKPEIVTMGVASADPRIQVGTYIEPDSWNELISEPGVVVIDTRNHYESRIGTFEGSVLPETDNFRQFPDWVKANEEKLTQATKIAMFCTGGIRCERASAYMLEQGFGEVYHLHGGILKYLETIPENNSKWDGECFVFDQRVSVKHGLIQGDYDICYACREPIDDADKAHPAFVPGVSCPLCVDKTTEEQKQGYRERQKQLKLAKERDEIHIGGSPKEQN
tara:strand:+ start:953 stop:1888 length:936 start_codon:yes stop_codon:yes gene_type:complete